MQGAPGKESSPGGEAAGGGEALSGVRLSQVATAAPEKTVPFLLYEQHMSQCGAGRCAPRSAQTLAGHGHGARGGPSA